MNDNLFLRLKKIWSRKVVHYTNVYMCVTLSLVYKVTIAENPERIVNNAKLSLTFDHKSKTPSEDQTHYTHKQPFQLSLITIAPG